METNIELSKWHLRGCEMQYIIRQSGRKDKEFAKILGYKFPVTCHTQYNKPVVKARIRDACIELVGMQNYEYYLNEYRKARGIKTVD